MGRKTKSTERRLRSESRRLRKLMAQLKTGVVMDSAGQVGMLVIHLPRPWSTDTLIAELRDSLLQCAAICMRNNDPNGREMLRRCAGVLDEALRQHTAHLARLEAARRG